MRYKLENIGSDLKEVISSIDQKIETLNNSLPEGIEVVICFSGLESPIKGKHASLGVITNSFVIPDADLKIMKEVLHQHFAPQENHADRIAKIHQSQYGWCKNYRKADHS